MAGLALGMLKGRARRVVNQDPAAARAIIPRDKEVDALNKQIHAALVQHMVENPDTIGRCLHLMVVSKSLERIADHATNVAEDVGLSLRSPGHPAHRHEKSGRAPGRRVTNLWIRGGFRRQAHLGDVRCWSTSSTLIMFW